MSDEKQRVRKFILDLLLGLESESQYGGSENEHGTLMYGLPDYRKARQDVETFFKEQGE